MAEAATYENQHYNPRLEETRLLTDVDRLVTLLEDDVIEESILADIHPNYKTAAYEGAIPLAVAVTVHGIEEQTDEHGRRLKIIKYAGKNLVDVVLNGRQFYWSEAAEKRLAIEAKEVLDAQETLAPGVAKVFISPKMSRADATLELAQSENLADDDSIRVSFPITNEQGIITGRRMVSLLVRDVPLDAWVAMLKDPHNIFGTAFTLSNETSALSIMELFKDLELPVSSIPEGPVALVAAVQQYIKDNDAYHSVGRQLSGFRRDQQLYEERAEITATEWLDFDCELARSLKSGQATLPLRSFIVSLQNNWNDEQLAVITNHTLGNSEYSMTRELAAVLERAKRNLLLSRTAILTRNERVFTQLGTEQAQLVHDQLLSLEILRQTQLLSDIEYAQQQARIDRQLANKNIGGAGGGCANDMFANFREQQPDDSADANPTDDGDWESGKRSWKLGSCQVKTCPSPKPTEVGPCSVCKRCQAVFDSGGDPTKGSFSFKKLKTAPMKAAVISETEIRIERSTADTLRLPNQNVEQRLPLETRQQTKIEPRLAQLALASIATA